MARDHDHPTTSGSWRRWPRRVLIMYLGDGMEYADVDTVYHAPLHPYTRGLLNSIPKLGLRPDEELEPIGGAVPSLLERPTGCPFHPRCPEAIAGTCDTVEPPVVEAAPAHLVQCHLYTGGRS